jgi:hypothetical protein
LYACNFASGARDTAESVTSWFARWTTKPSNPSAIAEQDGHFEEFRQRGAPFIGLEAVLLVDPDPRQLLTSPRQLVAAPRQLLLLLQQPEPGCKPLIARNDLILHS